MDTGLVSCQRKSKSFISLSKLNQNDNEDNDNKPFFQCIKCRRELRKFRAGEHVSCSLSKINRLQEDGLEKKDIWEYGTISPQV